MSGPETAPDARGIIAVDGLDGSGKSVFARRLGEALGGQAVCLAVDDFRRPVSWSRPDRSELDIYYDERYDLADLDRCLAAFLAGRPSCRYRPLDGASERLGPEQDLDFADATLAIVEGVFAARLPHLHDACFIYLDIPREEAWRRVVARDLHKGRSEAEIWRRIQQRYLPAHERYLAECAPPDRAQLVIDNRDPTAPVVVRGEVPAGSRWEAARAAVAEVLGLSLWS
jgi:uridine kinase